jgi:hypothetical protein
MSFNAGLEEARLGRHLYILSEFVIVSAVFKADKLHGPLSTWQSFIAWSGSRDDEAGDLFRCREFQVVSTTVYSW